jgi:hypothetical protein
VIAASEGYAPILANAEPAAVGTVLRVHLLEQDHAVRDALDVCVLADRSQVVEQEHRAAASVEVLLQCQDLPAIPERASCQQPQLGK